MFSKKWTTSERRYGVVVERDVKITMSDGIQLCADIYRPDSDGKFPAILSPNPFTPYQAAPMKPAGMGLYGGRTRGPFESGDPSFYVRRGYVHVICSVRGTGKSGGKYTFVGPREVKDVCEVIEWMTKQPWCDANIGMFGVSYFAWIQLFAASLNPPHLKCIFAPWGATDLYRDMLYHGGILSLFWAFSFVKASLRDGWPLVRPENYTREELGEEGLKNAIDRALQDEDIARVPRLVEVLRNPNAEENPLIVDFLLHPLYGSYWKERNIALENIKVPAYIGADWSLYGVHLPGAFRSWERLKVPKKMIIGPPGYLDRPVYQMQYESLRWFDHWLKGMDNGIMDEPPIRLFVLDTGEWKEAKDWPLPETKWTPFYLHEYGLLSEHEYWPNEGSDSFEDSPWHRGYLTYSSPSLVENTEVIGPSTLNLYASTTDPEVLWFISLRESDPQGNEKVLTRGWLRGSHRDVDTSFSKPWQPVHPHTKSEPLIPNRIYEFTIPIIPTGILLKAGFKIGVRISCSDDEVKEIFESLASDHVKRQSPSRVTIYRNADYPSHLLLPITKGNILGTFISGGKVGAPWSSQ